MPSRAVTSLLAAVLLTSAVVPAAQAAAPGEVISSSQVTLPLFPVPVNARQILYRSTSATGASNAVSGIVLEPPKPWTGAGPRPVVAYAMGTQGLADECAPSNQLRKGSEVEIAFLVQAVQKGWAVAVTDYEGLGTPGTHTYAVGQSEGRALLDVARAATSLLNLGRAPIGVFGYSQGGQAAAFAGELWAGYAPELNVVGVAEGGVPADLAEVAAFNDGNAGSGLVFGAAAGYVTAYPELPLTDVLNARGRAVMERVKESCVVELALTAPFTRLNDLTTTPDVIKDPRWQTRLAENKLGTVKPAAPVYLYHGTVDELIPFSVGRGLRDRYCARGATVQWTALPLAGHIGAISVWGTNALNWLGDRFAGKQVTSNC